MPDIPYPLITDDFNEFRKQMLDIVRDIYETRVGGALQGDVFQVSGDVLELKIKSGSALKKVGGELDVDLSSVSGSGSSSSDAGSVSKSLYNARGVILVAKGVSNPVALPISVDTYVLRIDHTTETGYRFGPVDKEEVTGLLLTDSPTFVTVKLSGLTDDYIPYHINDATGLADSGVTVTELNYVSGVTSSIQTQINSKLAITSVKLPFYNAVGTLDTISLTADNKLPFFDSSAASKNIALTT